jgi:urease subunit gamma/beta
MRLTPWEEDRLQVFAAAEVARRRRSRGVRLNAPEATALMCDAMLEAARDGASYEEVIAAGVGAVAPADVLDGVRELVDEVRLEVLLDDGTRIVVLVDPLGGGRPMAQDGPGSIVVAGGPAGRRSSGADDRARRRLLVRNTSRRVVRVSSHMPFDAVNPRLSFDRAAAAGMHLDVPAGASERWEPGEAREVDLVAYGAGRSAGGSP